jgi:hypothetical protein
MTLTEMLYMTRPDERLGFVKDIIDDARSGNKKLRQLLTNKFVLGAGEGEMYLFWRRRRDYPNISKAANAYCRKFWDAGIVEVVNNLVPEPETGECNFESDKGLLIESELSATPLVATLDGFFSKPSSPYIEGTLVNG